MNAQQILKRLSQLKSERVKHESHWRDCYKYCAPERQQSFQDVTASGLSQERKQARAELYDTTACEGIQLLVSSVYSGTTSPVSLWSKSFADDVTLTAAMLDRLLHHCHVVQISGESYRLKDKKRIGIQPQVEI